MFIKIIILCLYVVNNLLLSDSYQHEDESLPVFLSASVGEYAVFDCDIEFPHDIPIPHTLNWKKQGKTIFSWDAGVVSAIEPFVGRIHLLNGPSTMGYGKASINLTAIRESDAGWYECKVIFPYRQPPSSKNGTWFYLAVNGGNLLEIPPINQTILEGEDIHFDCVAKEMGIEIKWFKDGIPITQLENIYRRSTVDSEGSLTIHSTEMGDLGEYLCEAVNYLKESQSARAFLNVQYKAKVIFAPKEIFLPYGQAAVLDCHFRANPPLKTVRWEKDGFLFDPYNVPGVFYRQNGSLYFSKVDESHNGEYSCTPYNELGTDGPSTNIHVIVLRPPAFTITPHHLYLRKLGERIDLFCDARDGENEHKPIIVWYKKDGSSMPDGRVTIREGNLTITNIQEEDRGLYQCSATNEAATITIETELLVENIPPRAPHNLTALPSISSIRLHWVAGRKKPRIKYSVWYRGVDSPEWRNTELRHSFPLETTIYNLVPGREYEFMVLSEDPHGESLFSKPLRVWTLGYDSEPPAPMQTYSPIGQPLNVSVFLRDNGYMVTWEPPGYGIEHLYLYIVKWFDAHSVNLLGSVETNETAYYVADLEEGESYSFQVVAITSEEYQSVSDTVTVTVPAYKKIKIMSLSLVAVIIGAATALGVIYYVKTKYCRKKPET